MTEFTDETATIDTAVVKQADIMVPDHAGEVERMNDMIEQIGDGALTHFDPTGGVSSEKNSVFGIGIVKFAAQTRTDSYRSPEALITFSDAIEPTEYRWIDLRPNTSMKHLTTNYGDDLIAVDLKRSKMSFQVFMVELFSHDTKTARALVRKR